jgi:glycine dehydrogenase
MNRLLAKSCIIQKNIMSSSKLMGKFAPIHIANYSIDYKTKFASRHIGSNDKAINEMLSSLNFKSLDELTEKIVPKNISLNRSLKLDAPQTEEEFLAYAKSVAAENQVWRSYIGMGYYNCHTPSVIVRNIFENPGWITQYTPYQAELSQGRLESLLNYQTMICDLTGLDISNASLLDEGTAAAESMTMCTRSNKRRKFLVSDKVNPQTIDLIQTRANIIGIEVIVQDLANYDFNRKDASGMLFQYPNSDGSIVNLENTIKSAKDNGVCICFFYNQKQ